MIQTVRAIVVFVDVVVVVVERSCGDLPGRKEKDDVPVFVCRILRVCFGDFVVIINAKKGGLAFLEGWEQPGTIDEQIFWY